MKKHLLKLFTLVCLMVLGNMSAWADLTPTEIVNENFDDGTTTLFTASNRITVANDNNAKFTSASNAANAYALATYNFDGCSDAAAVKIQFAYWIANSNCNYDAAFVVRDGSVAAPYAKGTLGSAGAFFTVGKSRQSSANYFSVNHGKTIAAASTNLGLWCQAEIYIDLVKKTVDYTISNLETSEVIKSETGKAFYSSDASTVSELDFYACVNNETDYLDNLVITKYTDASAVSHDYTIKAMAGETELKTLSTGFAYENTTYKVENLPLVITKDGVCYKLADEGVSGYAKTFTMGTEDASVEVTYAEASDISYFFEAESINSKSYGEATGAYSSGTAAGVASGASLTMSGVAAGTYTVTVNAAVRRANADQFNVLVSTDGTNYTSVGTIDLTDSKAGDFSIEGITLINEGSIRLTEAKGQNQCHYIDYVTLVKTADLPETLETGPTIGTSDYATYVSEYNLDVPTAWKDSEGGYSAYAVKVNGSTATLTQVEFIPANTPVVLKATTHYDQATEYTGIVWPYSADPIDTDLKCSATDITADGTQYILANGTNGVGFYKATVGTTIAANKGYLVITDANAAKALTFAFDGDATAISNVDANADVNSEAVYNVAGQKVNDNFKGIVIKNGKKYLNK